ncbi:hypothetical protein PC116_g31401 [Phytophthora cactorum]|nr:hypothetical protein PC116_g31401 [Phytophthora cactorum]
MEPLHAWRVPDQVDVACREPRDDAKLHGLAGQGQLRQVEQHRFRTDPAPHGRGLPPCDRRLRGSVGCLVAPEDAVRWFAEGWAHLPEAPALQHGDVGRRQCIASLQRGPQHQRQTQQYRRQDGGRGRGDLLIAQPPQELRERRAELGDEQR